MTDNRTTELRISEPLRGFIRHQSNRAYIDGGQARWLTKIADEIDAKHEQAVDDARIVEVTTSHIDIEQGEVITRFVPEQAIAVTLGGGTCHMSFIDEYETASGEEEYLCECSECGYRRWELAHDLPLFCSKCGKAVKQ